MQRQDDVKFDRFTVSVDYMEAASLLAITFDDSNISFFDARSMAPRNAPDDLNTITSMPQAGFTFPSGAPGKISHTPRQSFQLLNFLFDRASHIILTQRLRSGCT